MKIIGLHGFQSSSEIFLKQTKYLRKFLDKDIKWYIPNAPNISSKEILPEIKNYFEPPYYQWYDKNNLNNGYDYSINFLKSYNDIYGPFDGVIGFSQGASMAYVLSSMTDVKFIINICGVNHPNLYNEKVNKVNLNIIGNKDPHKERSLLLSSYFNNPIIFFNNNKHVFPYDTQTNKNIVDFINLHNTK